MVVTVGRGRDQFLLSLVRGVGGRGGVAVEKEREKNNPDSRAQRCSSLVLRHNVITHKKTWSLNVSLTMP